MRHFDLSPLYRSTVGFDRLFSMLDTLAESGNGGGGFPPYDIARTGENAYRITMAVAGFAENDLSIELKEGMLTIRGERPADNGEAERQVLHRGIAQRGFERRFQLADHVQVRGASLENGLLHVDLEREVPEALRPRTIPIGTSNGGEPVIDQKAA